MYIVKPLNMKVVNFSESIFSAKQISVNFGVDKGVSILNAEILKESVKVIDNVIPGVTCARQYIYDVQ